MNPNNCSTTSRNFNKVQYEAIIFVKKIVCNINLMVFLSVRSPICKVTTPKHFKAKLVHNLCTILKLY